ncbi:MAG: MFS transporter [Acidimicrobiia bacterium]|nr:MFS transporter [Acidimicrobiia bacterium]
MPDVARLYLNWQLLRAFAFRGYWLVTSVYLVVVADLSPFQLVIMGTAMEVTILVSEVPTGVMADTVSRRASIVVSHIIMGIGMVATGLVTDFAALVATQMLWGFGYTFASGADIAWITDELGDDARIDRILTIDARRRQYGAIAGMVGLGLLAWVAGMGAAIVAAGFVMLALGLLVALRFTEQNFTPTRDNRWQESIAIFRRGVALGRADQQIMLVLAVTLLVNSGAEAFDRLHPKRLIDLGFPEEPDPIVWFTVLGVAMLLVGAMALRVVEARINREGAPRLALLIACLAGAIGMLTLAHAPNEVAGIAGTMLVGGVAWTVIRAVSSIWVNRRTTSDVRATVQSFLGQTESIGEIAGGVVMAIVAQAASITVALTASAGLLLLGAGVIGRSRVGRVGRDDSSFAEPSPSAPTTG